MILYRQRKLREQSQARSFMSQQYNKALFTLSYLVSLQLRKYMEMFRSITQLKLEDLRDPEILNQKQA